MSGAGTNYRESMVEMHISEIGFCSGHFASGVWVDENARTTIPAFMPPATWPACRHNYMLGAFVNGGIAGQDAAELLHRHRSAGYDAGQVLAEQERVLAPTTPR